MRVFTTRINLVLEWISSNPKPSEARRILKAAANEIVLAGDISRKDLRKAILDLGNTESVQILEAIADVLPIARGEGPVREEELISAIRSNELLEFLEHENWISAYENHTNAISPNENREAVFGRVLGHLVSAPVGRIEIIDQFFSHKILNQEMVFAWFLGKLRDINAKELVVHTSYPRKKDDRPVIPNPQLLAMLLTSLDQAIRADGFSGLVRLNIYSRTLHDRFWKVDFSEGSAAFTNGYGLDVFKSQEISGAGPFSPISPDHWTQLLFEIQKSTVLTKFEASNDVAPNIEIWTGKPNIL